MNRLDGQTIISALSLNALEPLARSVPFIFALRDSGAKFIACDMPEANTLTIGLLAAMAQHERELISERTKAALAAKKARGFKLASPQNLTKEATSKASEARRRQALEHPANRRATELASLYRERGLSYAGIAKQLNSNGHRTRRGKMFSACTVKVCEVVSNGEKLAESAEIDHTYVSMIERGKRNPTLEIANRLAEALDVKLSKLIRRAKN